MIFKVGLDRFNPLFETVVCYIEARGRMLLLLRHDNKSEGNKRGVPADKIDKSEDPVSAIVREVAEETGQSFSHSQFTLLDKVFVRYPEYDFIFYMFKMSLENMPKIVLSEREHKDFKWV